MPDPGRVVAPVGAPGAASARPGFVLWRFVGSLEEAFSPPRPWVGTLTALFFWQVWGPEGSWGCLAVPGDPQ